MSPQRPGGGGGRAVSAQKERESGAEVVEAVGARRVEQGAAGLDVEQSATESDDAGTHQFHVLRSLRPGVANEAHPVGAACGALCEECDVCSHRVS